MKKLTLRSVHTERNLKYISTERDIFDESYKREVTLFGIFNLVQTFELYNEIKPTVLERDKIQGFIKNNNGKDK